MTANPQDFAYFSRGESPPWNKGTGATTGFDYFNRGEAYPALIPTTSAVTGQPQVWTGSAWAKKPVKVWTGSAWVAKPMKRYTGSTWVAV